MNYHKGGGDALAIKTELVNYTITICNAIKNKKTIIFIDETSFHCGLNKRCGYRKPKSFNKIEKKGRGNNRTLILAISKDKPIYGVLKDRYINKKDFFLFFMLMLSKITTSNPLTDYIFVMDNLRAHKTKNMQTLAPYTNIVYTPRYSPDTNAIEYYFSYLKTLVKRTNSQDLYIPIETAVIDAFKAIDKRCGLWAYKEMVQYLYKAIE